jgi:predicted lactoylglutathione lyase
MCLSLHLQLLGLDEADPKGTAMTSIQSVTLQVSDVQRAGAFYGAFGVDARVGLAPGDAESTGFRGFTMSLVVSGPATVDGFIGSALEAGASELKPVKRSFWGYGGVVSAPDGSIWKVATSAKKDAGPDRREVDEMVLLLGVDDIVASKRYYTEHGLTVGRSFARRYVEFESGPGQVKLALYGRRALAKDAGVSPDGSGSHRIVLGGDGGAFIDPDGFAWENAIRPGTASAVAATR